MNLRSIRNVIVALLMAAILAGIGGAAFLYSGVYDIAAARPHTTLTRFVLTTLQQRSVRSHARDIEPPALEDPDVVRRGFALYREHCVACHGAPGEPRARLGVGLNPNPPPLVKATESWSTAELYWIVENGLKMAGMPAFGIGERPRDLWAIVAFLERMRWLSPGEYRLMAAATEGRVPDDEAPWLPDDDGWARLRADGDPDRGAALIDAFGCDACHVVPGVPGANGRVGPPLVRFRRRHYIAGSLVNTPDNLVDWIADPQRIEPGTAMPDVGVTPEQALDIVAYLYTLE